MMGILRSQATLKKATEFVGHGVHSDLKTKLVVYPAAENTGFVFKRTDIKDESINTIKLSAKTVVNPVLCTRVSNEYGISVSVIEHLLGALRIIGITNALIETDSEEIPIMDGSAFVFVDGFKKSGIKKQHAKVPAIVVRDTVVLESGNISISPNSGFFGTYIDLSLDYERINKVIGKNNRCKIKLETSANLENVINARTFGWLEDCAKMRAIGMAKGASEENTVVINEDSSIFNKSGLRSKDEIVCHKALDLIGDISVIGYDIVGKIKGLNTSHAQNNEIMNKLINEIDKHAILTNDFEILVDTPNDFVITENYDASFAF